MAELGLDAHVTFFPFTREPVHVFEVIDVLVLASLHKEGLPNVLLEALSMGVPVVSSRLAGTPEVVLDGETGLLVEPGDIDELAAAIERLGTDRTSCQRMGAAGRELMVAGLRQAAPIRLPSSRISRPTLLTADRSERIGITPEMRLRTMRGAG